MPLTQQDQAQQSPSIEVTSRTTLKPKKKPSNKTTKPKPL